MHALRLWLALLPGACAAVDLWAASTAHAPAAWLEVAPALRVSDQAWSTAGDAQGNNPNILTEYTWEQQVELGLQGELGWCDHDGLLLRAGGWLGVAVAGDTQQSDYAADGRTSETFRTTGQAGGGWSWQGEAALGWRFTPGAHLAIEPEFSLSTWRQHLPIHDLTQSIPANTVANDVNSSYHTSWDMATAGATLRWQLAFNLLLSLRGQVGLGTFAGKGNLNGRDDLAQPVSFQQESDAWMWRGQAQLEFIDSTGWGYGARLGYEQWRAGSGEDRLRYGPDDATVTQFNGSSIDSMVLACDVRCVW